jgi:hypothetical protein
MAVEFIIALICRGSAPLLDRIWSCDALWSGGVASYCTGAVAKCRREGILSVRSLATSRLGTGLPSIWREDRKCL